MAQFDYDLVVIGAGSGGVRAARVAAGHGAKVLMAEEFRVGGTCVIRGCVPKKLYVLASRFRDDFEDAAGFGWRVGEPEFDWPALVAAKEKEITRLSGLYAQSLTKAGVEIVRARAALEGKNAVRFADGRRVSARVILVATGAAPVLSPEIPGIGLAISSNEIFDLPVFPRRLLVIGGSYISVEFASIFTRLGATVQMSIRAEHPLRGFDEDLRRRLHAALERDRVVIRPGVLPTRIEKTANGLDVTLQDGSHLEVDQVLAGTGRRPSTNGLGLEAVGVALRENGAVIVDERSRSSVESVYAVGDVTDRVNLTPVAIREGQAFADTVFGERPATVDYHNVPTAVFTTPEIGTVGLGEDEAKAKFSRVDVYETSFRPMRATLSRRAETAFMKIVVDATSDRVLGVHILGESAAEMTQMLAISLQMGARKSDIDAAMALHPTMAEELVTMRAPARRHQREG